MAHGLTDAQLKECMGINKHWGYVASKDGWVVAHDIIRADQEWIEAGISVLAETASKTNGELTPWQMATLQSFWAKYVSEVHHHHENEEKIFFPYMDSHFPKDVKVPPKMSSDHVGLLALMDSVDKQIKALDSMPKDKLAASLATLAADFSAFKKEMNAHLAEEEEVALPMLRFHFTHKTIKPAIDKIISETKPENTAWFLRHLKDDAARKSFFREAAGIPGPVLFFLWALVFGPAVRKDEKMYVVPFRALMDGATAAPKPVPAGLCG